MILTTSSIILHCSKLGSLSSNQGGLSSVDILTYANLATADVLADVAKTREEFIIYREAIPVTANQDSYRIPYRSVGGTLRHLWFEDTSGGRSILNHLHQENLESYTANTMGAPGGFYVQGYNVVLVPNPQNDGSLVVSYPFRPSELVDQTQCSQITAVDYNTNSVTIASIPINDAGNPAYSTGALYDFIDHRSGNNIIYYDLSGTVAGTTITFSQPIPNVIVGNWICLAGQAPMPMLPEEVHPLVLELTVYRIEVLRGNTARMKASAERIKLLRDSMRVLLNSRIASKPTATGGGNPFTPNRMF